MVPQVTSAPAHVGTHPRLKILHVLGGTGFGGAIWIVDSYVVALRDRGHEVIINASEPSVVKHFTQQGFPVWVLPEFGASIRLRADMLSLLKLARYCRREQFDVVHTHTSKGGFIGRAAARLGRVPVILHTAHGFAFHEGSNRFVIGCFAFLERIAGHWCSRLLTVSEFHRNWAIELGIAPPEKIGVVRNGIRTDRLVSSAPPDALRGQLSIPSGADVIGIIGRLARGKGIEVAIEALAVIHERGRLAYLVIAGTGPLESSLRHLVNSHGMDAWVRFIGHRDNIGDVYAMVDVVVAPTFREGLSVSILEAMACGKPVVASDIGPNAELIQPGSGILTRLGDARDLADNVRRLLEDSQLSTAMGERARRIVAADFTERRMIDSLFENYRIFFPKGFNEVAL